MREDELKARINEIIVKHAGDDEAQHSLEDKLHRELIALYCPYFVRTQISELSDADFARWRA